MYRFSPRGCITNVKSVQGRKRQRGSPRLRAAFGADLTMEGKRRASAVAADRWWYRGGCGSRLDDECASPSVTMNWIEVGLASGIEEGAIRWRRQPSSHTIRGSILDADPPTQGSKLHAETHSCADRQPG